MTTTPVTPQQTVQPLDFAIASNYSNRSAFSLAPVALGTSAQALTPIQIPAVGFLDRIRLKLTVTTVGGSTPTFSDIAAAIIDSATFRNAAGAPLLPTLTGYDLYLVNKWGAQNGAGIAQETGPFGTPFAASTAAAGSYVFFVDVPVGLDLTDGLGTLAATSSAANYQLQLSLAAASFVTGTPTSVTVTVEGTSYFFDVPPATNGQGVPNATVPPALGTQVAWFREIKQVAPGTSLQQSIAVGNVIATQIVRLTTAAGAALAFTPSTLVEFRFNNTARFSMTVAEWQRWNAELVGATAGLDAAGGIQSNVLVLPLHAILSGDVSRNDSTRAQLLQTLEGSLVQWYFASLPANSANLEILTETIAPTSWAELYSK